MSATGRSDVRLADDDYATPAWATDLVLDQPEVASLIADEGVSFVEPCAGHGSIVERLRKRGVAKRRITAIELDPGRAEVCRRFVPSVTRGDFFKVCKGVAKSPIVIVTNPPYEHAIQFVERCIEAAGKLGHVIMLLRLPFLESQDRAGFHRDHPSRIGVLSKRPSFAVSLKCTGTHGGGCGWSDMVPLTSYGNPRRPIPDRCPVCGGSRRTSRSDSTAYAWFHWHPSFEIGTWTILGPFPSNDDAH
jgi:hypothetical protein